MMVSTFVEPLQQISSAVLVKICYSIIFHQIIRNLFTSGQTAAFGGAYLSEDMDEDGITTTIDIWLLDGRCRLFDGV